jgi:excisionase family DNA binding protein
VPLDLLTTQEVADLLRVDTHTVRRWIAARKLDAVRLPGGEWRVERAAVEAMLGATR